MCVMFVGGIHQHETRCALRVIGSEHTDAETRDGGPDEHHWFGHPAAGEKFGELGRDAACGPRRWPRIAVTHARPVVGADTRESGDLRLDEAPARTRAAETRVEDHDRPTGPGTPQIQSEPADVDEMSGRWSCRQVLSSREPLVRGTSERSSDDEAEQTDEKAYRPTPHLDMSCVARSVSHRHARD